MYLTFSIGISTFLIGVETSKSIGIWFRSGSETRTINKEYYVYDTPALVGTIGGSLGLFLGFSFYDCLSQVIDFLFEYLSTQ